MASNPTVDLTPFRDEPRLLMEAELHPIQGERFQPTGFPDLGSATYTLPDGTDMLLVESAQSVANRLEETLWAEDEGDLIAAAEGLPYVRVELGDGNLTSSVIEPHRLHSPYIRNATDVDGRTFLERLQEELGDMDAAPIDVSRLADTVFAYDPNSVLHGVFFASNELAGGRLSLQRLVSGFIEARDARPAESGGVKMDPVDPAGRAGGAEKGYGHVPYHRTEYVADEITGYFNMDLTQLEAYGLPTEAEDLLLGLSLFKIRRFLDGGMRLRTACDLECRAVEVSQPEQVELPSAEELEGALPGWIEACEDAEHFRDPAVTELQWEG